MSTAIVSAILAVVQFIFTRLVSNAESKKKIAELLARWIVVMREEFKASSEVMEAFDKMWKDSESGAWTES